MKKLNFHLFITLILTTLCFSIKNAYGLPQELADKQANLQDSLKKNLSLSKKAGFKPVLLSSVSANVDTKNNVTTAKKAVMEVLGGKLLADELVWDHRNERLIAKVASFTLKDGTEINSVLINFNLKDGTYQAASAKGYHKAKPVGLVHGKMDYQATDSVRKADGLITLYGNANVSMPNLNLNGRQIVINTDKNLITAKHGSLRIGDKLIRAAKIQYKLAQHN
jgi:lipopolysaccharide assembly outer membrane protein LptD (OstA)